MVNFGEKAKIKKAGNLNEGRSYVITSVIKVLLKLLYIEFHESKSKCNEITVEFS